MYDQRRAGVGLGQIAHDYFTDDPGNTVGAAPTFDDGGNAILGVPFYQGDPSTSANQLLNDQQRLYNIAYLLDQAELSQSAGGSGGTVPVAAAVNRASQEVAQINDPNLRAEGQGWIDGFTGGQPASQQGTGGVSGQNLAMQAPGWALAVHQAALDCIAQAQAASATAKQATLSTAAQVGQAIPGVKQLNQAAAWVTGDLTSTQAIDQATSQLGVAKDLLAANQASMSPADLSACQAAIAQAQSDIAAAGGSQGIPWGTITLVAVGLAVAVGAGSRLVK